MNVVAIVQARMSSSRLPNKVLALVNGKPLLEYQIERILQSNKVNHVIVATSNEPSDDPIAALCQDKKVSCYRGSLNDVLDRFYQAAVTTDADHIVRLTGDCPLIDPDIIDDVVSLHLKSSAEYSSNCCPPTFPDGYDVEVFSFYWLEKAWKQAQKPSEREHVTPYIRKHVDLAKQQNFVAQSDLSHYRLTVDEPEDLTVVTKIFEHFLPTDKNFTLKNVISFLKCNPSIKDINQQFNRNEGLLKSLAADKLQGYDY